MPAAGTVGRLLHAPYKTGQFISYKTGQFICSLHSSLSTIDKLLETDYSLSQISDKGKASERARRKATGLRSADAEQGGGAAGLKGMRSLQKHTLCHLPRSMVCCDSFPFRGIRQFPQSLRPGLLRPGFKLFLDPDRTTHEVRSRTF